MHTVRSVDLSPGPRAALVASALWLATIALELARGRPPICTCGHVRLWSAEANSAENSQQIADWYSFSHVIHGLLFYGAAWLLARWIAPRWSRWAFPAAVALEGLWELAENSPAVIERYRAATVSLGYVGDSVLNSASDVAFMALGFWIASRLPWWASVAMGVGFELFTLAMIRDNLTLNVLMLVWPIETIRVWQAAG